MPRFSGVKELDEYRQRVRASQDSATRSETIITIGMGTCGLASGAGETHQAILRELGKHGLQATVREVGCIGMCVKEPLVDIQLPGQPRITYANIQPANVPRLIEEHLVKGEVVAEWAVGTVPETW